MPHHPPRKKSHEWWIVLAIILIAFVFRFQSIKSIPPALHPAEAVNAQDAVNAIETGEYKVFYPDNNGREGLFINLQTLVVRALDSTEPWVFHIVSAIAGVLTVLGLYALTKKLFNWQMAAIASFLMAISFWHVMFSRLGFRVILAPLFLVWAFNYLWRGKQTGELKHYFLSALFWGLGILSYTSFSIMLIVLVIVLVTYWGAVSVNFKNRKYTDTRDQIIRGFAMILIVILLMSVPMMIYFNQNPSIVTDKFIDSPEGIISDSPNSLVNNFISTFDMFTDDGDSNWLFNIPGRSLLFWPVSILFLAGLLRTFIKFAQSPKKLGHFSTVQVLLISWFFIGLIPALFAGHVPNAMLALMVAPVVFIFAAEGLWWLYEFISYWHEKRDPHEITIHGHHLSEGEFLATLVVVLFLVAMMFVSYDAYFNDWALDSNLQNVFTITNIQ
ncbi:MAG: glycosyltransferase family 39 protein [Parcubacteria group bacterium]